MKKNWLIFFGISLLACSSPKDLIKKDIDVGIEADIREFKIAFFQHCIASKHQCLTDLTNDTSASSDFNLGLRNYQIIDPLAKIIKNEIHQDSINWTNEICPNCDEATLQRMRDNGMIGKQRIGQCRVGFNC